MSLSRVRGVRWRLLGPVRLLTDAGERVCGPGKQQAVLAVLLATPGRPVPVEAIVEWVWGGRSPRQANPAGLVRSTNEPELATPPSMPPLDDVLACWNALVASAGPSISSSGRKDDQIRGNIHAHGVSHRYH
ncbi:MAG: hypothetical protein ACJ73S_03475 [Mycobacteriales bacterium]